MREQCGEWLRQCGSCAVMRRAAGCVAKGGDFNAGPGSEPLAQTVSPPPSPKPPPPASLSLRWGDDGAGRGGWGAERGGEGRGTPHNHVMANTEDSSIGVRKKTFSLQFGETGAPTPTTRRREGGSEGLKEGREGVK